LDAGGVLVSRFVTWHDPFGVLIVAPFALNFASAEGGISALYMAAGAAVLAVSLITNYQYSPKRQVTPGVATA
jgi:hypothetical protein